MAKKRNNKKNEAENRINQKEQPESYQKEPKILGSLVGTINEALSEDVDEINSDTVEQSADTAVEEPRKKTSKGFVIVGIFILIMAVIGVISSVSFCYNTAEDIMNQTALKEQIAQYIFPVVTTNPPEFTNATELPSSTVITSAIWKIIFDGNTDNYEKLYSYYMYVPEIDVEYAVRSLYGNGVQIEHQSIINLDYNFEYDAEAKKYLVPISPRYTAYTTAITNVTSVGEVYSATVEYIPVTAQVPGVTVENEPDKIMIYNISISKNVKTIISIAYAETDQEHIF